MQYTIITVAKYNILISTSHRRLCNHFNAINFNQYHHNLSQGVISSSYIHVQYDSCHLMIGI